METVKQVDGDFNVKKSKKKGLIIGLLSVLIIAVAAVLVYYFVFQNKPEKIFDKAIDKIFMMEQNNYNTIKMNTKIKASADLEDSTYNEYLDEIEKFSVKYGIQMDVEEKKEIVDLGLEYNKDSVIDARVYYNDGNLYAYFDELFDKYIKIDIDEEGQEVFNSIFETALDKDKTKNSEKALEIIKGELKAGFKEYAEFESEKVNLDLNGKDKKVTKSTLTLTEKDLYKLFSNMCSNLAENDKFVDCLEEIIEDNAENIDVSNVLDEMSEELKDEARYAGESKIDISIYSTGITNEIKGVEIQVYVEDDDQTIIASIIEEEKESYSYKISMKSSMIKADILKGTVVIDKEKDTKTRKTGKAIITAEIVNLGNVKIEIDYDVEFNGAVDDINVRNSINAENLTEEDLEEVLEKLKERPLIGEIIENLTTTNMNPEIYDLPLNNEFTTSQNQVKEYGYLINYSVPQGFEYESSYSSDYLKYYRLESGYTYISADVSIDWDTENEYIENDINWDYDYYSGSDYYKNVTSSEEKVLVVGDRTFKYIIISYETDYSKYQEAFVWTVLDSEHLFTVELKSTDIEITEDIINGFLNISVSKEN